MNNKLKLILVFSIFICGVMFYVLQPIAVDIYTSLRNYNKRIEKQSNYTKITTPLPKNVIDDICFKFEISSSDVRCRRDAIVYGPDFFGDIKEHFENISSKDATFETVQDKLGNYLIACETPDNQGYYACRYDIGGDRKYPILIIFTKEHHIYRIIANTSGS